MRVAIITGAGDRAFSGGMLSRAMLSLGELK
jgi:hypothetical protein